MAANGETDDLLKMYTKEMGRPLGPFFHHLWQDLAHLHLKWNEYLPLFGRSKDRVDDLNRAASGFFFLVQDMWWDDILLTLWKLTDKDPRTLSIRRLPSMVRPASRAQLKPKIDAAVLACKFAHQVRHNMIAHRNAAIAMRVKSTPPSTRADVKRAIAALDDVFDFVHAAYMDQEPMMWEHLDVLGGSEAVLWIVRRGLKARDDDREDHRPPIRFHD
jgi:hypothetical protein